MRYNWKTIILNISASLICIYCFVNPRDIYGWLHYLGNTYDVSIIGLVLCFIGIILCFLMYLINRNNQRELIRQLKSELFHIFSDSSSWSLGIGVASFLCGAIIFLFNYKDPFNSSAFDIASVYISSILGVLAIRAFFEKLHPIYDVINLLQFINKDLIELETNINNKINKKDVKAEVWFSFPGLNLGQFRVDAELGTNSEDKIIYREFIDILRKTIHNEFVSFHVIALNPENISLLYKCYAEQFIKQSNKDKILNAENKCIEKAIELIDQVKMANNDNTKFYEQRPEANIDAFIIVGDIVYTIQAWGFPIYKEGSFRPAYKNNHKQKKDISLNFMDPIKNILCKHCNMSIIDNENDKLVSLIAYRQYNNELAKAIVERTKNILE